MLFKFYINLLCFGKFLKHTKEIEIIWHGSESNPVPPKLRNIHLKFKTQTLEKVVVHNLSFSKHFSSFVNLKTTA